MIGSHLVFWDVWSRLSYLQLIKIYHNQNHIFGNIVNLCQIKAEVGKILILSFCHFPRPTFWKWPQGVLICPHFGCGCGCDCGCGCWLLRPYLGTLSSPWTICSLRGNVLSWGICSRSAVVNSRVWLAVCVRTRHIERDISELCRDIIANNYSTDNMSWSNWIMSRYKFNQSQHR